MKKLGKLKLVKMNQNELEKRKMNHLFGGGVDPYDPCGCLCWGPSSTNSNGNANSASGYGGSGDGNGHCACVCGMFELSYVGGRQAEN